MKTGLWMFAGAVALAALSAGAMAQRDPAYAAAREAKQVGEQPDGYLGVVSGGASVQAMVRDINIKRKAAYTASAQASGATVEQFAFTSGCNLVAKVGQGEMYKTPSGQWKENTGTPELDARCK
ncbi:YdbL family protein [Sphingomonas sp. RP10(2022)]|uniref:YdbL family protein n=1 Tax=Sphingomonas liriopis TaxID=2949094 RepID=A0A9X2HY71_9SPHN|nr:YdbL family protein [Sphingomonas liriopis]MCP3734220.1 YdbL family protein [Sphingomonas liriopis]